MTKSRIDIILGIILILMPFLGFPPGWKTLFYILIGLFLIIYAVRRRIRLSKPSHSPSIVEVR